MRPFRALLPALFAASGAAAQVPAYSTFELEARSSFTAAFNLPAGAFFANSTPQLGKDGKVAFDLEVLPASSGQGVWFGGGGSGSIVYSTVPDAFVLSVGLNNTGIAVWDEAFASPSGLYRYDSTVPTSGLLTTQPIGASSWGSPRVNDAGQVGYRAGFSGVGQAFVSYDGSPTIAFHATEVGVVPGSPSSFLFTPSFNGARRIAGKVRLGATGQVDESRPDQVRVFAPDGSSVLIAEDVDSNASSAYTRFDNAVSLTDTGWVAFVANLVSGGRGVFLSDGTTTHTIATEAGPEISSIEFFAPAANEAGLVAFRAFDETGLRAVWVGDGASLRAVAREHDLLPTDLGTARIDQHDASPVFGGSVTINSHGDVAFAAALTPPDDNQIEWGTGVFVALASASAIFADGFESGTTAAWSLTVP